MGDSETNSVAGIGPSDISAAPIITPSGPEPGVSPAEEAVRVQNDQNGQIAALFHNPALGHQLDQKNLEQ